MPTFVDLLPKIPVTDQLTLVEAHSLAGQYHLPFPSHVPALIHNIDSPKLLDNIKTLLMLVYSNEHKIIIYPGNKPITLSELSTDRQSEQTTNLYIPALGEHTAFEEFQELIAHLRAPEGCPWDREQTHLTLRRNLIEEAYEVIDAIDAQDPAAMAEEFGDLLVQVVLHTQIATEAGEFRMSDVLHGIITKLIRRHPHVFGDVQLDDADAVIANWEHLKADERKARGETRGILDGVAAALPALSQAEAYTARAARVGFEWPNIEGVLGDVEEEIREFRAENAGTGQQEAEFGDVLFALVNLARWLKIDPEAALRAANARFKHRFAYVEAGAQKQGRQLKDMTLQEMDALWDESKRQ